jgi:hypothetical protein
MGIHQKSRATIGNQGQPSTVKVGKHFQSMVAINSNDSQGLHGHLSAVKGSNCQSSTGSSSQEKQLAVKGQHFQSLVTMLKHLNSRQPSTSNCTQMQQSAV